MAASKSIDPTSAEGKAQNRVLASKVMADALSETLANLRKKAGITQQKEHKMAAAASSDVKGKGKAVEESPASKKGAKPARKACRGSDASTSSSDSDGTSDESGNGLNSGDESDATVSHISAEDAPAGADEDFEGFEHGIQDSEDESMASDSSFPAVAPPQKAKKEVEAPGTAKLDKKAKAALDRGPPTTSAFLPSLAGGYTVGDPDGSVYSYSGDEEPAAIKPERKNRRGQRARQAYVHLHALMLQI